MRKVTKRSYDLCHSYIEGQGSRKNRLGKLILIWKFPHYLLTKGLSYTPFQWLSALEAASLWPVEFLEYLYFIPPWLWHSKSLKIVLELWQAFYLKSAWDHQLISQLSATEELSSFCTGTKAQVSWSWASPAYYKSPDSLSRQSHCKKSSVGFCSIYRTIWASSRAKVTPVYSLNKNGLQPRSPLCQRNVLWLHLFSPLYWKVS